MPFPAPMAAPAETESLSNSGFYSQQRSTFQIQQLPSVVYAPMAAPYKTQSVPDSVFYSQPISTSQIQQLPKIVYAPIATLDGTELTPDSGIYPQPSVVCEILPIQKPIQADFNMRVDSINCQENIPTPPEERAIAEIPLSQVKECQKPADLKPLEKGDFLELYNLRKEVKRLKAENVSLKLKLEIAHATLDNFSKIFTEGQMRRMVVPDRRINWSWKDISSAICLHAAGPRAYHHLYQKGFPLPHVSTLQRWYRKADVSEGILAASITCMEQMSELSNADKICVLAFDEMKVAETYEYDEPGDYVRKPSNSVQVVIARGLLKSWKQPIFYDYDCQMTCPIIFSIISALKNVGFPVVAVVCDMGSTNRKLYKQLNVTIDKPWFSLPTDEDAKVFVFAGAPHLLKLIRNHFLDTGVMWNGKLLTSRTICDVLAHTKISDLSIAFKISEEHLTVKGAGRQNVNLAAQLFSNTVANAIRRCNSLGLNLYLPLETADFIQLVNDWFDVFNSSMRTFRYPGKEPFGKAISHQLDVLDRMTNYMKNPILPPKKLLECLEKGLPIPKAIPPRTSIEHFQRGILISNKALTMLYEYVQKISNVEYILTRRLNQDVVEHFFGAMRSKGGLNDHPTPKDFSYRLRKYILARDTECLKGTGNVSADSTTWLSSEECQTMPKTSLQVGTVQVREENDDTENAVEVDPEVVDGLNVPPPDDCSNLQEDALEYVSGYIIKKLNLKECCSTDNTLTWVDQVSKGYLHKPSATFLKEMKNLENIFHSVNGLEIAHCRNLKKKLMDRSSEVELSDEVKRLFFKCRIYFRIRNLNKRLKIKKAKQRIMGFKKFVKINI